MQGSLLILTEQQAGAVLVLAYGSDVGKIAATVSDAGDMS
jgi:hypothetical protein